MTDEDWFIEFKESLLSTSQPISQMERWRRIRTARNDNMGCPVRCRMLDALEILLPDIDKANTKAQFAEELILKMKAGGTIVNGDVYQGSGSTVGNDYSSSKQIEAERDDPSR